MSSVVRRTFASCPARSSHDTWIAIVDLLAKSCPATDREELLSVAGEASSIIADQAPAAAPIVVTSEGPRTRIYCTYDDDAVEGADTNESPLGFDPLNGEWTISLPCQAEDLEWVGAALKRKSSRITARDLSDGMKVDEAAEAGAIDLTFDPAGFLAP